MHSSDNPLAIRVWFAQGLLCVELKDGRVLNARYDSFPRLVGASEPERENWEIIGAGVGVHWPDLDEDLSTAGLLRDAVEVSAAKT